MSLSRRNIITRMTWISQKGKRERVRETNQIRGKFGKILLFVKNFGGKNSFTGKESSFQNSSDFNSNNK